MTRLDPSPAAHRPSLLQVWWRALRPATLPAGAVPPVVGTAVAVAAGVERWAVAAAALLGALLLQIGSNLVNDAADFLHGADDARRVGPARAAQRGWLTPRQLALGAGVAFALATALGIWLTIVAGWPIAAIGALGVAAAVAYTAGPVRLGYLGLGDVTVLVFFGPVAVVATYWAQAGATSAAAWIASAPVGLLTTAILVVNNLRDRHTDAAAGKRTLAVRLGGRAARLEYGALVALAYAIPVAAVALGAVRPGWLLPLATAPLATAQVRGVFTRDGAALNAHLGGTARLLLAYGVALALGAQL